MESCLYEGVVYHERLRPRAHRFTYRLAMQFIDLAEVPALLDAGLLADRRFSNNGLVRTDHFGDPGVSLDQAVRDVVNRQTGLALNGPIRLLTQLRQFGYYFSPLNLFYCYTEAGDSVRAIVAEVQNTPWLERHCYVLWQGNQVGTAPALEYRHPKTFHVSPFMGMDVDYQWKLTTPAQELRVEIRNNEQPGDEPLFLATMGLQRVPLTAAFQQAIRRRYRFMTARITAGIYLQAFRLWRKRCPFHPHPGPPTDLATLPPTAETE